MLDRVFQLNGTSSECLHSMFDAVAPDLWRRPTIEISQITAHAYLQDAANDYSGQYDRYTGPGTYKPDDPELYTALEEWIGRPILLIPERSELPPWMTFCIPNPQDDGRG